MTIRFFRLLADIRTFARHLESWVLAATVELPDYLKMGKIQGVLRIYVLYCLLILYSYPFQLRTFFSTTNTFSFSFFYFVEAVRRFVQSLRRQTSFLHLAQVTWDKNSKRAKKHIENLIQFRFQLYSKCYFKKIENIFIFFH